jgi:type IV pilus secretin PilQ/predicted competence protein
MKLGNIFRISLLVMGALSSGVAFAGKIKSIDFTTSQNRLMLILQYEGKGEFRFSQNEKESTIVVEGDNFELPARLTKSHDFSSKNLPVLQMTPYNSVKKQKPISKFVLKTNGKTKVIATEIAGKYVLDISGLGFDSKANVGATNNISPKVMAERGWSETDTIVQKSAAGEKGEETAKRLLEVLNAPPEAKAYFGSRVSFEGSKVDVHDVFRLIGEASGLNIITDSDVSYTSNYTLKNLPWDQVLDLVVQQANLRAKVMGNVVRIISAAKYAAEQESKLKELDLADQMEPVVMAVIPLSFATAEDMKTMIEALLKPREDENVPTTTTVIPTSTGAASATAPVGSTTKIEAAATLHQDFARGKIEVDSRSNSLVVTNTKETVERLRRLVKELDVALPQVLIDAKIIIASERFTKQIGMSWGGRATSGGSGRAGIAGLFNSSNVSLGDDIPTPFTVTSPTGATAGGGIGFQVGAGRHGNLNAQLLLAEVNGISKTVASPRVIVNNKKTANVVDGSTLLITTPGGANTPGSITQVNASLNLSVTPQVTSVGSVLLDLDINKASPGQGASIDNKSITTQVLVDSGSTLVLGGVYSFDQTRSEQGIPLLKDLPFLGQLFRTNQDSNTKSELMVFITPEIVDPNSPEPGTTVPERM